MDYQLTISPNIGFSSADFVAVWNVTTECRAVAEAHLLPHSIVVLKRREDLGVTEHAMEKLVKEVLRREGISGITLTSGSTQDGTPLLKVDNKAK